MENIQNINQKLKQIAKVLTFVFVFAFTKSWGQLLQWNTFGNAGTEATEPSVFNDPGVSATNITKGAGITAAANANRFGGTAWSTSLANAVASNDYLEFVVTPTLGCTFTPTSLVFGWDRSNTGPSDVTLRSSADGFVSNLGTLTGLAAALSAGNTITISGLTNIGTTTFRLYGYGAGVLVAGTGGFDQGGSSPGVVNVQLNGSTSCGCTPPSITTQPIGVSTTSTGIASYTVVAAGTSPTYQWQQNNGGGFANISDGGANPTYAGATSSVLTISNPPLSMSGYSYQCVVSNACGTATTNGTSTITVTAPSNAITTGAVSNPPFALTDCTITATGNVAFTSTGTFVAGNIYTAQLSNASGSFASAVNIGTISSTANSGSIPITIPAGTPSGVGYLIRVVSSSPSVTGSNSSAFTITLTCVTATVCPSLISAVINSCDGCASEGNNEFLVLSSGSFSFMVNSSNINITYSNGPSNLTSSFAAQPASLATLNTATLNACGTTFVDVSNGSTAVPPNSTLLIINKGACFTGDWSAYCGLGTVYVAFSAAAVWNTGGWFGNNTAPRNFVTNFSGVDNACGNTTYAYNQVGIAGTPNSFTGDGASVVFNGSSPPTYIAGNGICAPPLTILPIDLIDFYATKEDKQNDIIWKVAEETNVESYMIEKSADGINFSLLENTTLSQSKTDHASIKTYSVVDENPFEDYTYYRLGTKGKDGSVNYYKIISVDEKSTDWKSNYYQQNQNLFIEFKNNVPKNSIIQLFDLSSKLLVEENITNYKTVISTQALAEGLYFIKIQSPYKTENFKIIIQK